ncbi:hypothetical protein [Nostoc sp.]|uniref:hypothetical protein n=1 Tax=Nostoc sp. TaxID=1180 RepID=UPI002FFD092C
MIEKYCATRLEQRQSLQHGVTAVSIALAPRATVLASIVALQFLEGLVCDRFSKRVVKTGDRSLVNFRVLITNKAGNQQR